MNGVKERFLVADLSNSRTKIAPATSTAVGERFVIPTPEITGTLLEAELVSRGLSGLEMTVASVVPEKTIAFREVFGDQLLEVSVDLDLGIEIDFPDPSTIGPDRLANAVAAASIVGAPSVVVDFGTAVTFDVVAKGPRYVGGVIAPGLAALTDYLHQKTALLPKIDLQEPPSAVGKNTEDAMLAGAVIGYRGLVREILQSVCEEVAPDGKMPVIATGGYASLIAKGIDRIESVDQDLTLEGVRLIGLANRS